ncbi:unnamed protein product [Owenia fusiformis]|uniref:Peroxisomal 2,4-dienoyl-CoA reductase [(3E)-enoyl-CoA-producing] n=1 Tax=Owenia fusiformis TaxID=6347 RepID=A0A8J1UJI7_OWEFU|nr:unnamed protein product [Owenia fusiformis]
MAASSEEDYDVCMTDFKYIFNPDLLKDKVAFITGGGSGICFTIAETLMRHGCRTVIASRKLPKLQVSAERLRAATSQQCLPLQMDVRKPQEVLKAVDDALAHYGKIDILINGAAGNFLAPMAGLSYNAFRTVIEIDTLGTFNVCKAVYDKWFKKNGGNIVNITATLSMRGTALQGHAGSAKAAVDAMTRHMAVEWGPEGIRVNSLAPGPIGKTEGMRRLGGGRDLTMLTQGIPLQRIGTKLDIANCTLFLTSEAGSLITGQILIADGGSEMTAVNNPLVMAKMMSNI